MASIVFVTLYDEFTLGVRQLVANLREAGHEAHLICVKLYGTHHVVDLDSEINDEFQIQLLPDGSRRILCYPYEITEREYGLLRDTLAQCNPDIIGLAAYSPQIMRTREVSAFLRREFSEIPMLWGGPHATLDPEDSAAHADFVLVGEGDNAMFELMKILDEGGDLRRCPSLAWMEDGELRKNSLAPLVTDLDALPFTFHGTEGVHYIFDDQVTGEPPASSDLTRTHKIMTSRGCPYSCTFCILSFQKEVMPDSTRLRFRSIEHVMRELEGIRDERCHFFVEIFDDIFTMRKDRMRAFFDEYTPKIGMPFWCYTHPRYATEAMIGMLAENHAQYVVMGIESGSDRVANEVYNRRTDNRRVIEAARRIQCHGLRVYYDLISNNPFETEEDRVEVLWLLRQLPKPFELQLVELNFYPNIKIERMRRERGLPNKVDLQAYRFWNAMYHLASAIDLTDADVERFVNDPRLRENPELLESLAHETKRIADAKAESEIRHRNVEQELQCQATRVRTLEAELAEKTHRRGFRQFLWVSDRLRTIKRSLLRDGRIGHHRGNGHEGGDTAVAPGHGQFDTVVDLPKPQM
jgi:radical SAM superfamily enzyme YgiQ (UPF0313 family)